MPERGQAVESALHAAAAPVAPADVAEILETLIAMGRARKAGEGKFKS